VEASLKGARGSAPRPKMDIHNGKERGAGGAVGTGAGAHDPGAHADPCVCGPGPPASTAESGPCAGYSGLSIEACPAGSIAMQELRYPRTPTNRQSLGRLNPGGGAERDGVTKTEHGDHDRCGHTRLHFPRPPYWRCLRLCDSTHARCRCHDPNSSAFTGPHSEPALSDQRGFASVHILARVPA
jgi:hypothetical protein